MRRQPVAFALIDAAFLADSKFRKLRQRLPEPCDFNSAVGAWLIVLTSARRNGLPDVDAAEEAEDATFLDDLVAVGLLSSSGIPDKPFRAWAPRRPSYPSDAAPSATDATNATDTPDTPSREPSTLVPSNQLPELNGPREVLPQRPRRNTVDENPEYAAMRDAQVARYAAEDKAHEIVPLNRSRS